MTHDHPEAAEYAAAEPELAKVNGDSAITVTVKPTAGVSTYCRNTECGPCGKVYVGQTWVGQAFGTAHRAMYPEVQARFPEPAEQLANAALIVEAFNVLQVYGARPTELADQRLALVEIIDDLVNEVREPGWLKLQHDTDINTVAQRVREIVGLIPKDPELCEHCLKPLRRQLMGTLICSGCGRSA